VDWNRNPAAQSRQQQIGGSASMLIRGLSVESKDRWFEAGSRLEVE
jgi:hypothetical protein